MSEDTDMKVEEPTNELKQEFADQPENQNDTTNEGGETLKTEQIAEEVP